MVEYGKYLKLPFKPESRKGFLIYLVLAEVMTIILGIFDIVIKKKKMAMLFSVTASKELIQYYAMELLVILVILFIMGIYVVEYYKRLLRNEDTLPGLEAFSTKNLILCVKAGIIMIIWTLLILIIFALLARLKLIGIIIGAIVMVLFYIMMPAAYIRVIDTESIKEGLRFRTLFKIAFSKTFIVALIVAGIFGSILAIPYIGVTFMTNAGLLSQGVGLVLRMITVILTTYAGVVSMAWVTKAYQEKASSIF